MEKSLRKGTTPFFAVTIPLQILHLRCNDPKDPFEAPKRKFSTFSAQTFDVLANFFQIFTNYLPGFDPGSQEQENNALPLGHQL